MGHLYRKVKDSFRKWCMLNVCWMCVGCVLDVCWMCVGCGLDVMGGGQVGEDDRYTGGGMIMDGQLGRGLVEGRSHCFSKPKLRLPTHPAFF